jgi:predicted nucleic acid-binding protein
LYYGADKSKEPERAVMLTRQLLDRLVVLPLTSKSARKAGHIMRRWRSRGIPSVKRYFDSAIAKSRDFSVATKNMCRFQKIDGLKLIQI